MNLRLRVAVLVIFLAGIVVSSVFYLDRNTLAVFATPAPYLPLNHQSLLNPDSTEQLESMFERHDYQWPLPQGTTVPPLIVQQIPQDFPETKDMARKKSLFLRMLLPMALAENQKIGQQRRLIQEMYRQPDALPLPDSLVGKALDKLTQRYRIKEDFVMKSSLKQLLKRLDEIPASIVLAQGVIESGWGSSRFAMQGNSLFGEWTYNPQVGLAPQRRNANAKHLVKAFPNLLSSVKSYMKNINTGRAYREFRQMRANMRATSQPLEPLILASGLLRYSAKGQHYVDYVRKVIEVNKLHELDQLSLHMTLQ